MSMRLNSAAYQHLVDGDLAWLAKQPRSLERDHVEVVARRSVELEYGTDPAKSIDPAGSVDRPDILAVRALVDALPRCEKGEDGCPVVATMQGQVTKRLYCDPHREAAVSARFSDLPYAPALRALLDRMKGWE